jgi:predicted regulator of Ras-like GTPase activity (Roadblock/LC7/MglB family)
MDPISVAITIIGLASTAYKAARSTGALGDPAWAKYADIGAAVLDKGAALLQDLQSGKVNYDTLTEEQIKALLLPVGWDEIEARAKAELGQS